LSNGKQTRIMSGMRPTGRLHIGHYFGALINWVAFQEKYDAYYSIVDWHALTTRYQDSKLIEADIWEIALDWLAAGVDPEKSTMYVQSAVPEIAELHLLMSMITPQNWVERDPTLKDMVRMLAADEAEAKEKASYGLLGYPVLMACDIFAMKGELVPVGKDQEAHLEFARDLARRFNNTYGVKYFPEPKPEFTAIPLLKGVDGQKMGKSYNNDIKIADSEEETAKKVGQMITDRTRITKSDPGHTDLCEVPWPLYNVIAPAELLKRVKVECETPLRGCVECKSQLAEVLNEFFRPMRERRVKFAADRDKVTKILEHGNKKARQVAAQTLREVNEIMGMVRWV
jgi:tryptophanyl-tRNA synthetase